MSNLQTAYDYFISQGDSVAASSGIAAGLFAESQVNPSNINPTSGAYGIAQWLGGRLVALENMFGSNPSLQNELQFVQQELTGTAGTGNQGGASILSDTSPQQALSDFITRFERPAPGPQTTGDISRGMTALTTLNVGSSTPAATGALGNFELGTNTLFNNPGSFFGTLFSGAVTPQSIVTEGVAASTQMAGSGANAVTGDIAGAVASGVGAATKPLTDWLSGLTSSDTVTRVAVGLVAIVLVAAGIFFLAGNKNMVLNVSTLKGAV